MWKTIICTDDIWRVDQKYWKNNNDILEIIENIIDAIYKEFMNRKKILVSFLLSNIFDIFLLRIQYFCDSKGFLGCLYVRDEQ